MRFQFNNIEWESFGRSLALVTFTYPGDWQQWCPDSRTLVRHRDALKRRIERKWGFPRGVWIVEFQRRGAPHLHVYMSLPDVAMDELVQYGRYADEKTGKRYLTWPPLRHAWWKVVGSGDLKHAEWGVNVEPAWRTGVEIAQYANRVGEYFWPESGKKGYQKTAPEDFGSLRWWGKWGVEPRIVEGELSPEVFVQFRRIQRRWAKDKNFGRRVRPPRGMDGTSVFGVDGGVDWTTRVLRLCEGLATEDHSQPMTDRARRRAVERALAASGRIMDQQYAAERAADAARLNELVASYEAEGRL